MANLSELSIAARVATPHDPDWYEARAAWNRVADRDVDAILPAETCARLAVIKQRRDPTGIIQANHMLSLATV